MTSSRKLDYALLAFLALLWSTSFILIKIGLNGVSPFTLTAIRLAIAASVLLAVVLFKDERLPTHRNALILYLVVGLLGNTLPFGLISLGEVHVDASLTSVLMGIMPIATFVLAHFFIPSESMTRRKLIGVSFGITGLVTLLGVSALSGIGDHVFGQSVILIGALCYAITTTFIRKAEGFKSLHMATGATIAAFLTCLPIAFIFEKPLEAAPTQAALIAIICLGLFHTAVAALVYFRVIRNLGAVTFSQVNYLIPILGSIWGALILSETITPQMMIALGFVLIGIYFVQPRNNVKKTT